MPRQAKRAATSKAAAEPKAKKQQLEDPLVTKCNAIISALRTAEGFAEATIEMLEVGARACLTKPKESRHAVQNAVVEMIREVLSGVEAGHAARVEALRGKIAEADAEKARREAAAEVAAATLKEKFDAVEAAEKALEEANVATSAATQAQQAAAAEKTGLDVDLGQADGKKALAEQVVSQDLSPLKDGTAADADASVKNVAEAGARLGLEAQLIQSAEHSLRKAPAERGSFDSMVTQQLSEQFANTIASLIDQLANRESLVAERVAKVDDCNKQVDAAVAHREACREQVGAAKAARNEAVSAKKAAEQSVKDFGPEMEEAAATADAADALLVACKADLATFTELVEGPPTAPEAAPGEVAEVEVAQAPSGDAEPATAPDSAA